MRTRLSDEQLAALPVCFTSRDQQTKWLASNGCDVAIRLFDSFGWKPGWVPITQIAIGLFPTLAPSTGRNYTLAVVRMLVAEGKFTKEPQLLYKHGAVSFDVPPAEGRA